MIAGKRDLKRTAGADEVALAGQGFNAEVEDEFRKNSELDYKSVDKVESYKLTNQDKLVFLHEGGLAGAEVLK